MHWRRLCWPSVSKQKETEFGNPRRNNFSLGMCLTLRSLVSTLALFIGYKHPFSTLIQDVGWFYPKSGTKMETKLLQVRCMSSWYSFTLPNSVSKRAFSNLVWPPLHEYALRPTMQRCHLCLPSCSLCMQDRTNNEDSDDICLCRKRRKI